MKTTGAKNQFSVRDLRRWFAGSVQVCLAMALLSLDCLGSADIATLVSDPRSAAMGDGTFSQRSSVPSSALNNPASLVGINRICINFNNISIPPDIKHNQVSFALPTLQGNLGISLISLDYGKFEGMDNNFNSIDVGAVGDSALVLSYAMPLYTEVPVRKDYGSLGVNLKFLHSSLAEYTSEAIAFDLGGIYNIPFMDGLTAGLAYKNTGSSMKFVTENSQLTSSLNFGVGYENEKLNDLTLTLDYSAPKDMNSSISLGAAVSPIYFMTFRAGWKQTSDSLTQGARIGFGFNLGSFNLDYAYVPVENFGEMNMVSLGVALGNITSADAASDYYLDKHFREAVEYYYKGDYIEARKRLEDILSAYPDHGPSHKYLEKIMAALEEKDKVQEEKVDKWLLKADRAYEKKDYIVAERLYNRVLYSDPYNHSAKLGLEKIKKTVTEIKQEENIKKNLDMIKATWKEASRLYRQGDLVKSKEEFNKILAIDPENQDAKRRILEIDEQLSRIAAAKINELYSRGLDLYRTGKYDEAIKYFEAVVIASPNRLEAQDMIKRSQQNMKDIDSKARAEKLASEQGKMKGEMVRVFDDALKAYEKGDLENALEKFRKSEQLAITYEFDEYIQDTKNYITVVNQALTDKHYKIGTEQLRGGRLEAAVAEFRKALDYNPENTMAKNDLQRISGELAQRYYEQGMAYFARSDMGKAKEMFKKSLSYEPDKLESKRALERIE